MTLTLIFISVLSVSQYQTPPSSIVKLLRTRSLPRISYPVIHQHQLNIKINLNVIRNMPEGTVLPEILCDQRTGSLGLDPSSVWSSRHLMTSSLVLFNATTSMWFQARVNWPQHAITAIIKTKPNDAIASPVRSGQTARRRQEDTTPSFMACGGLACCHRPIFR